MLFLRCKKQPSRSVLQSCSALEIKIHEKYQEEKSFFTNFAYRRPQGLLHDMSIWECVCVCVCIYIYIYAFLSSNVKKYNLTTRHLSYSYISILANLLRTDNEWNEKCKNYIQLDQLKKIKRAKIRLKRKIKCYKIKAKKLPMYN